MSKKKAQASSVRFQFENDSEALPAINVAFQQIVQWAQLYRTGDAASRMECRDRLMKVSEAWLAWQFEEAQNTRNGFSGAEQRQDERQPEWDRWQARAEEVFKANPHLSKTAICQKLAAEFSVNRKTISNRVTDVGKPRKNRQ